MYVKKYAIETPTKPYFDINIWVKITKIVDHSTWKKMKLLVSAFAIIILPNTQQFILIISPRR